MKPKEEFARKSQQGENRKNRNQVSREKGLNSNHGSRESNMRLYRTKMIKKTPVINVSNNTNLIQTN